MNSARSNTLKFQFIPSGCKDIEFILSFLFLYDRIFREVIFKGAVELFIDGETISRYSQTSSNLNKNRVSNSVQLQ